MFVLLHDTATTEIYTYRHTLSLHGALPISPRAVAVALRRSFADLGPTYVKFGQLLASSPGLLPGFLATEFRRLLDAVPPESPAKIRRVIESELGASVDELFATFDEERKSAVQGKRVSLRVDLGGRRIIKKKK